MALFDGVTIAGMGDVELLREYVKAAKADPEAPELQPVRAELSARLLLGVADAIVAAVETFPEASEPEVL